MSEIDRPLFIIGTGRCGSSLLLRMLGYHPDLAWMSHYTSYLPGSGVWARLARVHDVPGLTALLPQSKSRMVPRPTENYRLLNEATDAVFTRPEPLTEDDVTPEAADRLRQVVRDHLTAQGKPRFVMKHTGFPRVRYLQRIFPDARFVHVVRDGRAVAASLCAVDWWSGEGHWGWGPLSEGEKALYAESGFHELVLAGLYWKKLMGWLDNVPTQVPASQLIEVRYDELVADAAGTLRRITEFAELPWTWRFAQRIAATPMTSDDTRWRRTLNAEEQALIERTLRPELVSHGFMSAS
jgi:hypothetical protein